MFEPKYVFIFDKERSREYLGASGCVRAGADRIDGHPWVDGYRVHTDINQGVKRDLTSARSRAVDLLKTRPIGTVVYIDAVKDGLILARVKFRKTESLPPIADTRGPIGLDRVEGWIEDSFPKARFAGDCVCKPNSDHADCAAVDYFDTAANMVQMRNFLLDNASYFQIKYIILFDRIWYSSGSSVAYTGDYHSHIHISVNGGQNGAAC